MACVTEHKTTVSYVWLTTVMTHSFFIACSSWLLLLSHVQFISFFKAKNGILQTVDRLPV
jgi:hypothetical protein